MKNLIPFTFFLTLLSCTYSEQQGNKYHILFHLEQQEPMDTRYLPKTEKDSVIASSDSVAYLQGAVYLLAYEQNLQRMKAEGLGVYKRVKGFTVTDSTGKDIKPNLRPSYVQRVNAYIEDKKAEIWMSTIGKE